MSPQGTPMIESHDLRRHFPIRRGVLRRTVGSVRAVDGVDLDIHRGETVGLVGESGSGKSTIGRLLLRQLEPTSGSVLVDGADIANGTRHELRALRSRLQMIFQDPYSSLNPRRTVGASVLESLEVNFTGDTGERRTRLVELFDLVRLGAGLIDRYPHELSGGQRQRVGIARALAAEPDFIVADEAIAALDVSIQAQIVNLLQDLQAELELTYLFITHDLAMARHVSDRIVVLYLGKVVEVGEAIALCERPRHPYTRTLLSAVPVPDPAAATEHERIVLDGEIPSPSDPPPGCHFHTRCPWATDLCRLEEPPLVSDAAGSVACHHTDRISAGRLAVPSAPSHPQPTISEEPS